MFKVIRFLLNPDTPFNLKEKLYIVCRAHLPMWINRIIWVFEEDDVSEEF